MSDEQPTTLEGADSAAARDTPAGATRGLLQWRVPNTVALPLILGVFVAVLAALWFYEKNRTGVVSERDWQDPRAWILANRQPILDGADGAWGFNFSPALIPVRQIVYSSLPRDFLPTLNQPDFAPAGALAAWPQPRDLVLGLIVNGQARAYPLNIVQAHECVNDTLGGQPVAVFYCPLTGAALAVSRRAEGRLLTFGHSGLLYQSGTLFHDQQADPQEESLWNPLQLAAVCGPAAGRAARLAPLDTELTTWKSWRARFPQTTVLTPNTGFASPYGARLFADYASSPNLIYPVTQRSRRRLLHIEQFAQSCPKASTARLASARIVSRVAS